MAPQSRTERTTREKRPERPQRIPVGGFRDKLTVHFKDSEHREKYYARWVKDDHENGGNIIRYIQGGYEFIPSDEVTVGQTHVFKSENVGTIVRQPADKEGNYLYLMRLPMEYHKQDLAEKARVVDSTEEALRTPDSLSEDMEAVYGSIKLSRD